MSIIVVDPHWSIALAWGDHANEVCWHAVGDDGRALCGTDLAGAEVLEGTLRAVRQWDGPVCTRCAELTGA